MIYIGIDPGVTGGIAAVDELGIVRRFDKMPATERDLLAVLEEMAALSSTGYQKARAVLERVGPGLFGGKAGRMGVTSAFTFGRGVGALKMALTAAKIPFDEVPPAKWQAAMMCRSKGDKNVTKRRAQQLFPREKVTHAVADALILAEYCRRVERQRPVGPEEHIE